MANSEVPAWAKLISLLVADHDVSSVDSLVSISSYPMICYNTPLTARLTGLVSAQENYPIYHQVKVAKGHINKLHKRLRETLGNNNFVLFHPCTLGQLQCQFNELLFSCSSSSLGLQKM